MRIQKKILPIILTFSSFITGCLAPRKLDAYVAGQYDHSLPKQEKIRNTDITLTSSILFNSNIISLSENKTSKVLPLIVYWQYDYRHICTLNPSIAVNSFIKTINTQINKGLVQKINGQKLELTVEEIPNAFSLVDKGHVIWLVVYAISWDRLFVEPDSKDLIISYKLLKEGTTIKSGKISVKGNEQKRDFRFFQSWKSATSEYLIQYNLDINNMTKSFVDKLIQEL